jgi:hypothetical protein
MATTKFPLLVYQAKPKFPAYETFQPSDWIQFWIARSDLHEITDAPPTTGHLQRVFRDALAVPVSMRYIGQSDYGVSGNQLRWPPDVSSILNVIYAGTPIDDSEPPIIDGGGSDPTKTPWVPIAVGAAALLLMGSRR